MVPSETKKTSKDIPLQPLRSLAECKVKPGEHDTVWYVHHANTGHVDYMWFREDDTEMFIHPANVGNWEALCRSLEPRMGCRMYVSAAFHDFVSAMVERHIEGVHGITCEEDCHWRGDVNDGEIQRVLEDYIVSQDGLASAGLMFALPFIIQWESANAKERSSPIVEQPWPPVPSAEGPAQAAA